MAKRFTDTDKWERPWFRALPPKIKAFWIFICDKCDIAGIWYVDLDLASYMIGEKITAEEAHTHVGKQIKILNSGSKWQVIDFIPFQYGELKESNAMHRGVMKRLSKGYIAPKKGLGRGQGKGNGKGIGSSSAYISVFDELWSQYPRKLVRTVAYQYFAKTVKTDEDVRDIRIALSNFLNSSQAKGDPKFIPYGSTWFNRWVDYINYKEPVSEKDKDNEIRATLGLRPKA